MATGDAHTDTWSHPILGHAYALFVETNPFPKLVIDLHFENSKVLSVLHVYIVPMINFQMLFLSDPCCVS